MAKVGQIAVSPSCGTTEQRKGGMIHKPLSALEIGTVLFNGKGKIVPNFMMVILVGVSIYTLRHSMRLTVHYRYKGHQETEVLKTVC